MTKAVRQGRVAERFKAPVLKCVYGHSVRFRLVPLALNLRGFWGFLGKGHFRLLPSLGVLSGASSGAMLYCPESTRGRR
jgi:hypothetical protein